MRKKIFVALLIITILAMTTVLVAATIYSAQWRLPQTATAPVGVNATFTINGQPWTNGTTLAWGQLQMGDNTMPINVTNAGSVAIGSITMNTVGLPAGWSETITVGAPVGATYSGTITLHADATVIGLQSWTSTITLTST